MSITIEIARITLGAYPDTAEIRVAYNRETGYAVTLFDTADSVRIEGVSEHQLAHLALMIASLPEVMNVFQSIKHMVGVGAELGR